MEPFIKYVKQKGRALHRIKVTAVALHYAMKSTKERTGCLKNDHFCVT